MMIAEIVQASFEQNLWLSLYHYQALRGFHKTDFPQPPRGYSIPTNLLEFEIAACGNISKSSIQLAVYDTLELYK